MIWKGREAVEFTPVILGDDGVERIAAHGFDILYLVEARAAARRAHAARKHELWKVEMAASSTAILLSAISCEAYLSEHIAIYEQFPGETSRRIVNVRESWGAERQWKELYREEAPEVELGASKEFQSYQCLVQLRNELSHRNATFAPRGSWPEKLQPYVEQGVFPYGDYEHVDWTTKVLTHPVAVWATETAAAWIEMAETKLNQLFKRSTIQTSRDFRRMALEEDERAVEDGEVSEP